jgi:serine/threonine-protein kinase
MDGTSCSIGQGVYWARSDGAGQPQPLISSRSIQLPNSYASDGKRIAYFQVDGVPQIWTMPVEEKDGALKAGKPERFLTTAFSDSNAAFSSDGRWIAYVSLESGRPEVYVRAFGASSSAKWQISNNGGLLPKWSPGGRELLYLAGDQIMSVEYTVTGDSFAAGKPRAWAAKAISVAGYDPAPDGKRLAVMTPVVAARPSQEHTVVFLQNFFDELGRRAPVDR